MRFACIGAGFTGAVIARQLAEAGYRVTVFDQRTHIGGNCHTKRDPDTGIMEHKYGPHIFHTDDELVWQWVQRFGAFTPYTNRVKTTAKGKVYSLPINLHTINQYFGQCFSPNEAYHFIQSQADHSITQPRSFKEQALKMIGPELYNTFLAGYTQKQWGIEPEKLPASILKRLPVRFNYDDNYFYHRYQGIATEGYTKLIGNILEHGNIELILNHEFERGHTQQFQHVFYSGTLDGYFNHQHGELTYRTLDFIKEQHPGDYQGCAVMNYPDIETPYTRITEHKHFSPWEQHENTIIYKEYSRLCSKRDTPYYPVRLLDDKTILNQYIKLAESAGNVSFVGRLGTYQYMDMDVTIKKALYAANITIKNLKNKTDIPSFFEPIV